MPRYGQDWTVEKHLDNARCNGIGLSFLSYSAPFPHFGDEAALVEICRQSNDMLAEIKLEHPDEIGFSALLPVPYMDAAIAETRRSICDLNADGVKLPSNVDGLYLGAKEYDPLFEVLDELNAVVTIHPEQPPVIPQDVFTAGPLPLFEYVGDTTRAVTNMIANGTVEKYPNISFLVPHCGSFLPAVIYRLNGMMNNVLIPKGLADPCDVLGQIKSMYFDVAGDALPAALGALITMVGTEKLVYGSDFPYTPGPAITQKQKALLECAELADCQEDVFRNNALRLFKRI